MHTINMISRKRGVVPVENLPKVEDPVVEDLSEIAVAVEIVDPRRPLEEIAGRVEEADLQVVPAEEEE